MVVRFDANPVYRVWFGSERKLSHAEAEGLKVDEWVACGFEDGSFAGDGIAGAVYNAKGDVGGEAGDEVASFGEKLDIIVGRAVIGWGFDKAVDESGVAECIQDRDILFIKAIGAFVLHPIGIGAEHVVAGAYGKGQLKRAITQAFIEGDPGLGYRSLVPGYDLYIGGFA
jgi:hypothetical protein